MLHKLLREFRLRLLQGIATKEDLNGFDRLIEGLFQTQAVLRNEPMLAPLRGFAISPDAIGHVLHDLHVRDSSTRILEFGSGQSTIILASCVRNRGMKRLVSVEHDAAFAQRITLQLETCGLAEFVEFVICPLVEHPSVGRLGESRSYALDRLPEGEFDVILIDGPPMASGIHTRFHPLRWSAGHLAPNAAIYLDDAYRPGERDAIAMLLELTPDLLLASLPAEKGLARLARSGEVLTKA